MGSVVAVASFRSTASSPCAFGGGLPALDDPLSPRSTAAT